MFKLIDPNKKTITISTNKNFKIVTLSDFHVGGKFGYLPKNCKDYRGTEINQSTDQEKMEINLLSSFKSIGQIDVLILLGDMIEGKNPKSFGLDIVDGNLSLQRDWCVKALSDIINIIQPKIVIGTTGSGYHVEETQDMQISIMLEKIYPNIQVFHGYQYPQFILGDKYWKIVHQIGQGTSMIGTLESYWSKMNKAMWDRERVPDVIGFGHIHRAVPPANFVNGKNPVYGFISPCQKLPDPFCNKTGNAYWEIGYLYMEQENTNLWGKYINTYRYWEEEQ